MRVPSAASTRRGQACEPSPLRRQRREVKGDTGPRPPPCEPVCPPRPSPPRLHFKWGKTKRNTDLSWFLDFSTQARSPGISQHSQSMAEPGRPSRSAEPPAAPRDHASRRVPRSQTSWVRAWLKLASPPSSRFYQESVQGLGLPARCGRIWQSRGGLLSNQLPQPGVLTAGGGRLALGFGRGGGERATEATLRLTAKDTTAQKLPRPMARARQSPSTLTRMSACFQHGAHGPPLPPRPWRCAVPSVPTAPTAHCPRPGCGAHIWPLPHESSVSSKPTTCRSGRKGTFHFPAVSLRSLHAHPGPLGRKRCSPVVARSGTGRS